MLEKHLSPQIFVTYDQLIIWFHESFFQESWIFLTKFAASFDLLKTDFWFENQNIQKCHNNHSFLTEIDKKKSREKQSQIDNSGFVNTRFLKPCHEQNDHYFLTDTWSVIIWIMSDLHYSRGHIELHINISSVVEF